MSPEQTTDRPEREVIDPSSDELTLKGGLTIKIRPLRTRSFFKLFKIITHGAYGAIPRLMSAGDDFADQLMVSLIFAIPEREEEVVDFLRSMIELPESSGPFDKNGRATTVSGRADQDYRTQVLSELNDPELEDTFAIIERIIMNERGDLVALGNRIRQAMNLASKTGQFDQLLADGQEASMQSAASMDGQMTPSSTSPSEDSETSSTQSENEPASSSN